MLGESGKAPKLQQLLLGDYYASTWVAGYLGPDRILYDGTARRANSSLIVPIADGYSKRSYFSFDRLSFYTYLNATVRVGDPYVRVSLQVQPLNSTFGLGDHLDLQIFAAATGNDRQYAFENATLFDSAGNMTGQAPFNGAITPKASAILIAYSNRTNVFDQDSVAIAFNSTNVASIEHWYQDGAFDGLSWIGLGYNTTETGPGAMSSPVYADVYPIQHLDFRLLSDTVRYLASHPEDVAVSPPVSFGFVARGLALASSLDPSNQTLRRMAIDYWNFYYERYEGTKPDTAYARATNLLALAGFELFQRNQTVEHFTKEFVEANPGSSIEEYGWGAAALQKLYNNTGSVADFQALQRVEGSFTSGGRHYLGLVGLKDKVNSTFEFGEAAAGLLSAGVQYNSTAAIWAMNAVFASNSSDTLFNSIQRNDLANTETIPAIMLSTWLFDKEMRNTTTYWMSGLSNCNVTSILLRPGTLTVDAVGRGGDLIISNATGSEVFPINGIQSISISVSSGEKQPSWWLLFVVVAVSAAVVLTVWIIFRKRHHDHEELRF